MKRTISKVKALSAFKKLGAMTFIVATTFAFLFTACKQTGEGVGKPMHTITFKVEGSSGGTLKAKTDAGEINSGDKVEQDKIITFTATPNEGYQVKGWKLDNNPR